MSSLYITASVGEITTHCLDPVTEQAVRNFINTLGLKDVFKDNIYINTDHTSTSKTTDENHNPKLLDNRFTCQATPVLNPLNIKWPTVNSNTFVGRGTPLSNIHNVYPVYQDLKADTNLVEHNVPCSINMECSMSFKDRSVGYEVASRLHNTYRDGELLLPTDLLYDYPLPEDIYTILYLVYKLRGLNTTIKDDGNPYTFLEYLREYSNNKISVNVNRNTSRKGFELIVQTSCYNCLAQIEYEQDKPDIQKSNQSTDLYILNFTITIQFSRVDLLYLSYPVVINNQLVPYEYVPYDIRETYTTSDPISPFMAFKNRTDDTRQVEVSNVLQYPRYDRWVVPKNSGFKKIRYEEFFVAVLTLDLDLPSTDIDLTGDLGGGVGLRPEVITQLQKQGTASLYPYDMYNIAVYSNEFLIEPSSMTLTDGTLLSIPNRNKNRTYRLVLSVTHDVFSDVLGSSRVIKYDIISNLQ